MRQRINKETYNLKKLRFEYVILEFCRIISTFVIVFKFESLHIPNI